MTLFNNSSKIVNLLAFAVFVFLAAWSVGYVFAIARAMFFQILLYSSIEGVTKINDFVNLYMAGGMGLVGHPQPIYDPIYQLNWSNKLIAPAHLDKAFLCPYAPFVFLAFAPLALLPMPIAFIAWVVFSLLIFSACIVFLEREESRLSSNDRVWILLGTLASLPTYAAMYLGEVSFMVTGFVLLFYVAFKRRKDVLAGVLLALTTFKPTYTPFLCVPALAQGRWILLVSAALTELLLFGLSGGVFGFSIFPSYIEVLLHGQSNPMFWGHNAEKMASLRGVLTMIAPDQAMTVNLVVMLIAIVCVFVLWRKLPKDNHDMFRWLWSITIVAGLCFSPHEHLHDCLPMVLPAVLTLETVSFVKIARLVPPSLRIWHICLFLYPFLSAIVYLVWDFVPPVRLFATPYLVLNATMLGAGAVYYRSLSNNKPEARI